MVRLTAPDGASVSGTGPTLLDTGTASLKFGSALTGGSVVPGTTVTLAGATSTNAAIVGLPNSTSTLADGPTNTYKGQVETGLGGVTGIAFFMQNSVLPFLAKDELTNQRGEVVPTSGARSSCPLRR